MRESKLYSAMPGLGIQKRVRRPRSPASIAARSGAHHRKHVPFEGTVQNALTRSVVLQRAVN